MADAKASDSKQFKSIWTLGGLTPWQLTRNVFAEIGVNNLIGRASELASIFYLLSFR
jgi:hypothetical protein